MKKLFTAAILLISINSHAQYNEPITMLPGLAESIANPHIADIAGAVQRGRQSRLNNEFMRQKILLMKQQIQMQQMQIDKDRRIELGLDNPETDNDF